MKTLHVELADRTYPIFIGENLLSESSLLASYIENKEVLIVTNTTIAPLYLERVVQSLSEFNVYTVTLPDGEQYKSLEVLNSVFDKLLEQHCSRQVTLIALGGGVIGDMTGFAAACYQRGVPFIQIPTTLLSQVDSSVGGKTAVNHALGKNMIGAFYQPKCVIADTSTLNTLDERQLSSGLAEVIKYGIINDIGFFEWLEEHIEGLVAKNPELLAYAIERSCMDKAQIVASDERENGVRALLNLGHTFGHAIETGMGYGNWLHGEAVAVGMIMAAKLSALMGWISENDVDRVTQLIARAGLPTKPPKEMTYQQFMDLMAVDKKVKDGKIRFVLLKDIGASIISDDYDPAALKLTLESFQI
jgi:3-dehydroquinate synthase